MSNQSGNAMSIPTSISLIEQLCEFNGCQINDLGNALHNDIIRNNEFLRQLNLMTTHLKQNNLNIVGEFLTRKNAHNLLAIRGRMAVSVEKFFYLRHRRRLHYPYLPCVAVRGGRGHLSFYPLETLFVQKEKVINI
jgi:hypothetical protein